MKQHTTSDLKSLVAAHCDQPRTILLNNLIDKIEDRLSKAPASSAVRYHHAYEGGLVDHIYEVFNYIQHLVGGTGGWPSLQSFLTAAILHDLGKIGDSAGNPSYVPNILKSGKVSDAIPYEKDKEKCRKFVTGNIEADSLLQFADFSDGEASLALVAEIAPDLITDLTESEVNAIRYHDGGYGKAKYAGGYQGKEDQLAIILHAADMLSSRKGNWATTGG